jgi:hypothetical protein
MPYLPQQTKDTRVVSQTQDTVAAMLLLLLLAGGRAIAGPSALTKNRNVPPCVDSVTSRRV